MEIREILDTDYEKVIEFNSQKFPGVAAPELYFQFRFKMNPFLAMQEKGSLILLSEEDRIIGQALLMPSQINVDGTAYNMNWEIDYYVEPGRRGINGVLLAKKAVEHGGHFGVGLTKVSEMVHLALEEKIVGYFKKYIKIQFISIIWNLKNVIAGSNDLEWVTKNKYKSGKWQALIAYRAEDIKIDNIQTIEVMQFTRSTAFLNWRFYLTGNYKVFSLLKTNKTHKKQFGYFVLRMTRLFGIKAMILVDYRYSSEYTDVFRAIIQLSCKIGRQSGCMLLVTGTSVESQARELKKLCFRRYGQISQVITNMENIIKRDPIEEDKLFITLADSDLDFWTAKNIFVH